MNLLCKIYHNNFLGINLKYKPNEKLIEEAPQRFISQSSKSRIVKISSFSLSLGMLKNVNYLSSSSELPQSSGSVYVEMQFRISDTHVVSHSFCTCRSVSFLLEKLSSTNGHYLRSRT